MAQGQDEKHDDAAMRARLDALSTDLDAHDSRPTERAPVQDRGMAGAMSLGFRVLTEFVAGIVVGAIIGWWLDKWFHTTPILLIVFLTLGTAAGFWNVYRMAMNPSGIKPDGSSRKP